MDQQVPDSPLPAAGYAAVDLLLFLFYALRVRV